ncbi:MAG: NAD(P)-dependent oxidoreductase [Peptococcaceae bacterium]
MKLGFIGLGAMGKPMAQNLLNANYRLYVYDIVEKSADEMANSGAYKCLNPQDLATKVDVIITMLPNSAIVESVMTGSTGIFSGAREGQIIIDMSSVAPHSTQKMAALAAEKGLKYLDAPVSGGATGACAGTLTIMVGGEKEVFEAVKPVLNILGNKIKHIGQVSLGDAVKLINNLLLGVSMSAVAEALVLGKKLGLDPEVMFEMIKSSSGRSYALEAKVPNFIFKNAFNPGFAIDLQYKDLELAIETGKRLGVPLPVTNIAQQVFEIAKTKGLGKEDISAVIKVWEEMTGVEVRGDYLG